MTAYRCTGEHSVRPYAHNVAGAIVTPMRASNRCSQGETHDVIAHPATQTPSATLETRGNGHLGEASLTPTVSRGRYGFIG